MKKVKNLASARVVLYGLDGTVEKCAVIPAGKTVFVQDFIINNPAAPSEFTETFTVNGLQKEFVLAEDINQASGVTVKINGQTQSGNYTVQERPGTITFNSIPQKGAAIAISYTNWANSRYENENVITVTAA